MHWHDVKTRPGEAASGYTPWAGDPPADTAALEQHASEGCSVCARILVNGRELAVDLALIEAPVKPSERARDALLARARKAFEARRASAGSNGSGTNGSASNGSGASGSAAESAHKTAGADVRPARPRVMGPSTTVARMHIALPGEAERIREIDELAAGAESSSAGARRMLAQLSRFLDFPVLFVSIVRGERVGYRAQRGLPESLVALGEVRREMTYCTHCISADAPLVVENAGAEAFFRDNKALTRFGVAAYAGVPLRSARGIAVGTLCALDFAPRAVALETVAVLEVFSRRAAAEIERERTPAQLGALLLASSERGDLYTAGFFRDLLAAERGGSARGRPSALLTVRAEEPRRVLSWIDEHETAGHLDGDTFGILLPGAGPGEAEARFARLGGVAGASALGFTLR